MRRASPLKSLIAISVSVLLLLTAGYLATTTVSEQQSQECATGDEVTSYRNTWDDVYFAWYWWPKRDDDKVFSSCIGPATYLRYHPYDGAALAAVGAGIAGWVGLRGSAKMGKK